MSEQDKTFEEFFDAALAEAAAGCDKPSPCGAEGHTMATCKREHELTCSFKGRSAPCACPIICLRCQEREEVAMAVQVKTVNQLRSYGEWGFCAAQNDPPDPIYMEALRIENIGFEAAHELMSCGHSRGDFRDSQYGTPEYAGNEKCIGCQKIEAVAAAERERYGKICLDYIAEGEGGRVREYVDESVAESAERIRLLGPTIALEKHDQMTRIQRDGDWAIALGKAVGHLGMGIGFKNNNLDEGAARIVAEIERKVRLEEAKWREPKP